MRVRGQNRAVALLCMPWKSYWMPSLQLATLASWVRQHVPTIQVDEVHHYLDIAGQLGHDLYDEICKLMSCGEDAVALPEALYGALLFPNERDRILELIGPIFAPPGGLDRLLKNLEDSTRDSVQQVASRHYPLVGFSVSFFQTLSSLYYSQQLREIAPDTLVVFGGPEVPGEVGLSLLSTFDWIDFVATGEGEVAFQRICEILVNQPRATWREAIANVPTIVRRGDNQAAMPQSRRMKGIELSSLDRLPIPSFDAYFEQRPAVLSGRRLMLPIETSRGCWWDRSNIDPRKSCSFCNLNATWTGYREKSPLRAASEIHSLTKQYNCNNVMIVDNVLRQGPGLRQLLPELVRGGKQRTMILEAKASLRPEEFSQLRLAGTKEMQLGIEALSNGILQRLINKGTSVMANIRALRWLEELGIRHVGNLILHFPGATADELKETLENIDYVSAYQPLIGGKFWLGYYSPIYRMADERGIFGVRNIAGFDACLPEVLRSKVFSLWKDFDCTESDEVSDLWEQIAFKLKLWEMNYEAMRVKHGVRSLLLFRDDGELLSIADYRDDPVQFIHLSGVQRETYLAATKGVTVDHLDSYWLSDIERSAFIAEMVERRLMYAERRSVVALAVHQEAYSLDANPMDESRSSVVLKRRLPVVP